MWYVETAVEGSEIYCCNTGGDRNSVVSQASCRMDVARLEQRAYINMAVLIVRGGNARVSLWGQYPSEQKVWTWDRAI